MSIISQPIAADSFSAPVAEQPLISHTCAGLRMTPAEYRAHTNWERGYRYELIQGVLVVNPPPPPSHQVPNDVLGWLLRSYQESHPEGKALDETWPDFEVTLESGYRIADRVIWCGLGRRPDVDTDTPAILIEFVSEGLSQWRRDYELKRDEYLAIGIKEYWVFDRFARTMTIFQLSSAGPIAQVLGENEVVRTPLLPGFELPLAKLLACSDGWPRRR